MERMIGDRENEQNVIDRIQKEYDITFLREASDDAISFVTRNGRMQENEIQSALKLLPRTAAMRRNPPGTRCIPCMADIERVEAKLISEAATKEGCRGKGVMRQLMSGALAYQNQMQVPLCLVETDNAEPKSDFFGRFGFHYICDMPHYELNTETISIEMLERAAAGDIVFLKDRNVTLQVVEQGDMLSLAHFVNARLCRRYGFFTIRSAAYYERFQKNLRCSGGNLFQIMEGGMRKGCFAYTSEQTGGISEVVFEHMSECARYLIAEEDRKPAVMARIVNLSRMLRLISGNGKITIAIRIKDPVIAENDGLFIWYIDDGGSHMERVDQSDCVREDPSMRPEVTATIGELTAFIFGYINKLKQNVKFDSIYLAGPAWINEKY